MKSQSNDPRKDRSKQQKKQFSTVIHQSNLQLYKELKKIRLLHQQKQQQLFNLNKQYRIESIKNKKMKDDLVESEKNIQDLKKKQIIKLIEEYKGNKQSPLFYNQNGLSPFELMVLNQSRYTDMEGNICMICFMDLQNNAKILTLPCSHFIHKQCGVQHLLHSHFCPACNQVVKVAYQS